MTGDKIIHLASRRPERPKLRLVAGLKDGVKDEPLKNEALEKHLWGGE